MPSWCINLSSAISAGLTFLHHDLVQLQSRSDDRLNASHDLRVLAIQVLFDCFVTCQSLPAKRAAFHEPDLQIRVHGGLSRVPKRFNFNLFVKFFKFCSGCLSIILIF